MKVLWIVNTIFPAPSKAMGIAEPVIGGWMYDMGINLSKIDGVELAIATVYNGKDFKHLNIEGVDYFLLPNKNRFKYNVLLEDFWGKVISIFKPQIIHIHGTESPIGLSCIRKFPDYNYIVSIQGLVSVCSRYYLAGISVLEVVKNITLRSIIKNDNMLQLKKQFKKRGEFEIEYIKKVKNVIGRTDWDFSHTKSINQDINYHFCNESLRKLFYTSPKWSVENCERQTIFLSQAHYSVKGLHQVLKALKFLIKEFPNIKIKVGGGNITKTEGVINLLKLTNYGLYIKRLIKDYKLSEHIVFLDSLSEKEMIAEYLKANVFICPSAIENSSNSIGEAQLLGVPTIAAYVGGTPNMIEHNKTGLLYRFEEVEMLAHYISNVFNDDGLASMLSKNGNEVALNRHDRIVNLEKLLSIYKEINNDKILY